MNNSSIHSLIPVLIAINICAAVIHSASPPIVSAASSGSLFLNMNSSKSEKPLLGKNFMDYKYIPAQQNLLRHTKSIDEVVIEISAVEIIAHSNISGRSLILVQPCGCQPNYTQKIYSYDSAVYNTESTLAEPILNIYNPFETKLFPNPTADQSTFSIYIHEPAQFLIEVYSSSGQKIIEIWNGELSEGRHEFNVDLFDYQTGMYFVKVWSEKQEETVKVLKVE